MDGPRRHDPPLTSTGRRRRALLLVWACSPAIYGAADLQTVMGEQDIKGNQTRTSIPFEVEPQVFGSYLQMEFRLWPRLTRAQLKAPDGRRLDLTGAVRRLPAEQAAQPQRGDLYITTDIIRNPLPGRWHLELEHERLGHRHVASWQVVLQPRFAARLRIAGNEALRAGVEAQLVLETTDFGLPVLAASPGVLEISNGTGVVARVPWRQTTQTGRYEGSILLSNAGTYTLATSPVMSNSNGTGGSEARIKTSMTATVEPALVDASTASAPLKLVADRGPNGCLRSLEFQMPWHAERPGLFVLSVALPAAVAGSVVRATGSVDLPRAGPAQLKALLRSSHFQQLTQETLHQAEWVEVVRVGPPDDVLFRRSKVPLSESLSVNSTCRP